MNKRSCDENRSGLLSSDDPRYVRRLVKEIRQSCGCDGFYSGFGIKDGQRKFSGHVVVRKGRLIAREVGGGAVDLTGVGVVHSPRCGEVRGSRAARQY